VGIAARGGVGVGIAACEGVGVGRGEDGGVLDGRTWERDVAVTVGLSCGPEPGWQALRISRATRATNDQ
jgi:hypothetical protein